MSLTTAHPFYIDAADAWTMLRDFYAGENAVKAKNTTYLPATAGMRLDGMTSADQEGYKAYQAYKQRARVPDYVREAVEILVGLLHQKDAVIELPEEMQYLFDRATSAGEPLRALHRRINVEQLIIGRLGLLVDLPESPDPLNPQPYIALYVGESIRNWDDDTEMHGYSAINMVVLDESGNKRVNTFEWQFVHKYRVLILGIPTENEPEGTAIYRQGVFESDKAEGIQWDDTKMIAPMLLGKTLEAIPFTFINTKDLLARPDEAPLIGLAHLCSGIYQAEADYRHALYMQSQDTLVVIGSVKNASGQPGEPDAIRVGAGARIDVDIGGDAKYIGTSSLGLPEQRSAIENDRKRAQIKAGELVQSAGSQMESGVALSTRFTAQTATLNHIALSGAAALENALKQIARWKGLDESKVKVTPNLEFINFGLDGQNFVQIMQAKEMGFPISLQSLHEIAADRGLTNMDFEKEWAIIKEENKKLEEVRPEPVTPVQVPGSGKEGDKPVAEPAKPVQNRSK